MIATYRQPDRKLTRLEALSTADDHVEVEAKCGSVGYTVSGHDNTTIATTGLADLSQERWKWPHRP